jgi:catecholate siderophore receptor
MYNYEIGVKWSFFDNRLATYAALFRSEKRVPITGRDAGETVDSLKGYGRQIVQGLEVGASGNITEAWGVFGGVALMDSMRKHSAYLDEVRQRANPGDYGAFSRTDGDELAFTPNISASLWTTYRLDFGLTLGLGVQYVGSSYLGRPDDANRIIANGVFGELPAYTVLNLMGNYEVSDNVSVRLNIDNVANAKYAVSTNWPGTRASLGPSRSFVISTSFRF